MKSVILLLPTLLQIALVLALHSQTIAPPTLTSDQRHAEIREHRSELKSITARLDALESQGQQFVPRGGLTAEAGPHSMDPTTIVHAQTTSALGLVYSWGTKRGAW